MTLHSSVLTLFAALVCSVLPVSADKTWTDPAAALQEDPDFSFQGEYHHDDVKSPMGAQVVALGNGSFDIYILDGGLPGAGWQHGKSRTQLKGQLKEGIIRSEPDSGNFAVTIHDKSLLLTTADGVSRKLQRIERQSPTLGAKPPEGAVVLFDGSSLEHWVNGRIEDGHHLAAGSTSKQEYSSYTLHLEFRTPYQPTSRSQKRGNSGVYHSGRWETQILDSFGLQGLENECGGIYSISKPRLNMCLPPLAWQTYDVEFIAAKFDESGKRTAWPRITVRLNGTLVHENLELAKDFTTSAPITSALTNPKGPIHLQHHDNPVVFRNIWIIPGE